MDNYILRSPFYPSKSLYYLVVLKLKVHTHIQGSEPQ